MRSTPPCKVVADMAQELHAPRSSTSTSPVSTSNETSSRSPPSAWTAGRMTSMSSRRSASRLERSSSLKVPAPLPAGRGRPGTRSAPSGRSGWSGLPVEPGGVVTHPLCRVVRSGRVARPLSSARSSGSCSPWTAIGSPWVACGVPSETPVAAYLLPRAQVAPVAADPCRVLRGASSRTVRVTSRTVHLPTSGASGHRLSAPAQEPTSRGDEARGASVSREGR
jgi:hypothetical protein